MKDIIIQTHRGSLKVKKRSRSVKSSGSGCGGGTTSGNNQGSHDISPCDSMDALSNSEMFENFDTYANSPTINNKHGGGGVSTNIPLIIETGSCPNSPHNDHQSGHNHNHNDDSDDSNRRQQRINNRRRNKPISDIEILPEDSPLDLKIHHRQRPPPSPLTIRQDSSDAEILDPSISPTLYQNHRGSKWSKVKKAFLVGGSASGPSSPIHHNEFFGGK